MSPADELVLTSAVLTVAAPLAGATIRSRRVAAGALLAAAVVSLSVHAVLRHAPLPLLVEAHVVLLAALCALGAAGAACAAWLADPLDAVGAGLLLGVAATLGVFALGPAAGSLPGPAIDAALAAHPVVAVSSALNLDILRGPLLYELSPIAHRQFSYPAWWMSSGLYAVAAAAAFLLASAARLARRRTS